MRPVDLARRHGLSTQAVRNYEDAGIIPPAHRSRTGYRDYTAAHAAGLAAYLALVPAFGHSTSRRIMHAVTGGQPGEALEYVDDGHSLLARDRNTLRTVEAALSHLGASTPNAAASTRTPYSIGELARHLALNRWPGPWKALSRCWVCGCLTARRGVVGPGAGLGSGRGGPAVDAGDLLPDGEADGHFGAVVRCGHEVAAGPEVG
jgi:hypothetical protein